MMPLLIRIPVSCSSSFSVAHSIKNRMHTFHSLIRTVIITALLASSSGLNIKLKYFKAIHGTNVISTKAIFRTIKTSSQHVCYMSCGEDDSCQGYNYFPKEGRCELLDSQCLPGEEISSLGNIYMERLDQSE